ncbi:hypothetical protein [Micromonospora sp. CPCC 206061]|uniref:hypothetical protein n=1 Tax=Micromonospora sp. CPCC 206061 TaxID=3122410 RepID=UPI002FF3F054
MKELSFTDIDVIDENHAWAVARPQSDYSHPMALARWDGVSWRVQPVREWLQESHGVPVRIEAVAPDKVWVSSIGSIRQWNGTSLEAVDIPARQGESPDTINRNYWDVEAWNPDDVWVLVRQSGVGGANAFAVRHVGGGWCWTEMPGFAPNKVPTRLGVIAANEVWAVGTVYSGADGRPLEPLMAQWTGGQTWRRVQPPQLTPAAELLAVGGTPGDVWVVGAADDHPFAIRWNGVEWSVVDVPRLRGHLSAVASDGHGGVWVVGQKLPPRQFSGGTAYLLHRGKDSTAWTTVPNPAGSSNEFNDIANIPGTSDMWAVGGKLKDEYLKESGLAIRYHAPK